jgi:hypothetical protein
VGHTLANLQSAIDDQKLREHIQAQPSVVTRMTLSLLRNLPLYSYIKDYPFVAIAIFALLGKRMLGNLFSFIFFAVVHFDQTRLLILLLVIIGLFGNRLWRKHQRKKLTMGVAPFRSSSKYRELRELEDHLVSSKGARPSTPLRPTTPAGQTITSYHSPINETGTHRSHKIDLELTQTPLAHSFSLQDDNAFDFQGVIQTVEALLSGNNNQDENQPEDELEYFEPMLSYQPTIATLDQVSLESVFDAVNRAAEEAEHSAQDNRPMKHQPFAVLPDDLDMKYSAINTQLKRHIEEQQRRFFQTQMSKALSALQKATDDNNFASLTRKSSHNSHPVNSNVDNSPLSLRKSLLNPPSEPRFVPNTTPTKPDHQFSTMSAKLLQARGPFQHRAELRPTAHTLTPSSRQPLPLPNSQTDFPNFSQDAPKNQSIQHSSFNHCSQSGEFPRFMPPLQPKFDGMYESDGSTSSDFHSSSINHRPTSSEFRSYSSHLPPRHLNNLPTPDPFQHRNMTVTDPNRVTIEPHHIGFDLIPESPTPHGDFQHRSLPIPDQRPTPVVQREIRIGVHNSAGDNDDDDSDSSDSLSRQRARYLSHTTSHAEETLNRSGSRLFRQHDD